MRSAARAIVWLACSLAFACGDGSALSGDESDLRAAEGEESDGDDAPSAPSDANPPTDDELTVEDLECPQGGKVGRVKVSFDCGEITTVSCKDLSNVVVEFADGTRQRFEGLEGQRGTFRGTGANQGAVITRVWIKAGSNHSGDGPGYGERFDAPTQDCDVPPGEACVGPTCNPPPPPPPPPVEDCFVADGTCNPPPPPPPPEEECFVADGSCIPRDNTPPPPPPPVGDRSYL